METNYIVRPYQPGNEKQIVELLQLVFYGWPHIDLKYTPKDHWRWKYLDNPIGVILSSLAVKNDKVIGCVHGSPRKIKVRDEIVLSVIGADLVVHPDFRGRGITKDIDKKILSLIDESGIKFGYFITGNPVVLKVINKKGYSLFPHKVINLVRIKNVDLHLEKMPVENAWIKKLGYHIINKLNKLRNALIGSELQNPNIDLYEVNCFDERINDLWSIASNHYDFIVERRMDYLNWRFCDPRAGEFVIKQAEENGHILGYSILSINRFGGDYPIGYIVDLLTLPDRYDALEALVSDAVRYFDSNDINLINYQIVQGHPYERVFKRHGFLNSRIKLFICLELMKMEEELKELKKSHANKIFLSWGDHDVLPVTMPSYR